jgi:hypothetical protein
MGLYAAQVRPFLLHSRFDLGLPEPQHAAELFHRWLVRQQLRHLLQRESQITQGQQPVQSRQLGYVVPPVPGPGFDTRQRQQAVLVVVQQYPGRDLTQARERSDAVSESNLTYRTDGPGGGRPLQHITLSPGKIGDIARVILVLVQFEHMMIT